MTHNHEPRIARRAMSGRAFALPLFLCRDGGWWGETLAKWRTAGYV